MTKEYESVKEFYEKLTAQFVPDAYSDKEIKGWKFTTIDVYYIIERWNIVCGPYGLLWGVKDPGFYRATNGWSDNIYCKGGFWYGFNVKDEQHYHIEFEAVGHGSRNEGEKKALTNLISKASSYVGIGMDVFKGEHQDDPYVDEGAKRMVKKKPLSADDSTMTKTTQQEPTDLKGSMQQNSRDKLSPLGIKDEFKASLPAEIKEKAGLINIGDVIAKMYGQPKEKIINMNQNELNDLRFDLQKNRDKYLDKVKELIK